MKRKNVIWLPLISLLLLASLFSNIPTARAVATMYVEPPATIDVALQTGTRFNVSINIDMAHDLHDWQILMNWTPGVLNLSELYFGDFLDRPRRGPWGVLTEDAYAGQTRINVTDGSKFGWPDYKGVTVLIEDDFNNETNKVVDFGVTANELILETPLANTYTVAANASAAPWPTVRPFGRGNNVDGWALASEATDGPFPGVEGNGTLVILEFEVMDYNSTELVLEPQFTYYMDSGLNKKDVASGDLILSDGYFRNFGPGDANGDGFVDIFDIGSISAHWYPGPPIGPLGYGKEADINYDGSVDVFDIGITSANWGNTYP